VENITFQNTGPIDSLVEWLVRFKGEISKDSLIIEVDPKAQAFISKTYSDDKSLVRYSQISFSDANLEVKKQSEDSGQRILVGIYMILPKVIEAFKTFATSENFSLSIDYDIQTVAGVEKWCATTINLKSKTLKMKIPGSSIGAVEMNPLSDDMFFKKVWVAPSPVSATISAELLMNLVSISDIFASQEKKDNYMEFYTKDLDDGKYMFVRDPKQETYDYELCKVDEDSYKETNVTLPIYREKFLLSVKNAFDETKIIISTATPNRLLIELKGGNTKTIIAKVNR